MEETHTYSTALRAASLGEILLVALLPTSVETWTLPRRGQVSLGRGPTNDVCVPHESIDTTHARLTLGPRVLVEALGGGATRVDGVSLEQGESAELATGALLELGELCFVLQRRGAEAAPDASPEPIVLTVGDHQTQLSGTMGKLVELLRKLALGDLSLLVVGETGVGKDVVVELVHRTSARAKGPLVRVHCAALSPNLFESELFGHERGAFTGATSAKPGLLDAADGGTVFLDEVGELPAAIQVKLLRVLEDRRVTPVGSTRSHRVDVRFVAATHRDLAAEVEAGRFREDLYYRLCGFTVAIPPLRERAEEILPLAELFLERVCSGRTLSFDESARAALRAHSFPGNVRELRLVVERAAALAASPHITSLDLGLESPTETADDDFTARLFQALDACAGNQSEAARRLGVSRRTLVTRLTRLRAKTH